MAGDVELNPGPGSSRSSNNLNSPLTDSQQLLLAAGLQGQLSLSAASDPRHNDNVFNISDDEQPRCSVLLTEDQLEVEVATEYHVTNNVEVLSGALEGARLTPVTGDFVERFASNPTDHRFSTYVVRLLETVELLSDKTVWWFPYIEPKQLEDAIIEGFKV